MRARTCQQGEPGLPDAPLRECGTQGCRTLTRSRLCARCEAEHGGDRGHRWDTGRRPVRRITGRALQAMRARLFKREPLCRKCRERGRVTLATIRDHVVPLAEGGVDDETNEQPLCDVCSDEKTREESKRGAERQRIGK